MHKKLLAAVLLPFALSTTAVFADQVVKENFEDQAEGNNLSNLTNWKFFGGWIKPEDGIITAEKGNKFLRVHGDFFSPKPFTLLDKLTLRFKIRGAGLEDELGGLDLRSNKDKSRYDVLFTYKGQGAVVLSQDQDGNRKQIEKVEAIVKKEVFQNVVVTVEQVSEGVKFTVTVDGAKIIDKTEADELAFLKTSFDVGFFTYNQKTIDLDDIEFIQGK